MSRFLLDANLSPETAAFLASLGFDASVLDAPLGTPPTDDEVMALASAEGRVVITFDLDFGEMFYARGGESAGIIVLRVRDQA